MRLFHQLSTAARGGQLLSSLQPQIPGDADTPHVQRLHADFKALALLPQQILLRDDPVGEHDLGGVDAVQPILFSIFPTEKPGKVLSMMKAESPFVPLDLSVMTKITNTPALEPFVMKISSSR